MSLSQAQIRFLRGRAHHLKPVVILGQHGLTENVMAEVDNALDAHELIKVRVNAGDRGEREELVSGISGRSGAQLIHTIGHVAVFFRRNKRKPRIALPS